MSVGPLGAVTSAAIPINPQMVTSRDILERARRRTLYLVAIDALDEQAKWAFWVPRHDSSPFATVQEHRTSSAHRLFRKMGDGLKGRTNSGAGSTDDLISNKTTTATAHREETMLGKLVHIISSGKDGWAFEVRRNSRMSPEHDMSEIFALGEMDGTILVDTDVFEGSEEKQRVKSSNELKEFNEQKTRDEFESIAKSIALPGTGLSRASNSLTWAGEVVQALVEHGYIADEAKQIVFGPFPL